MSVQYFNFVRFSLTSCESATSCNERQRLRFLTVTLASVVPKVNRVEEEGMELRRDTRKLYYLMILSSEVQGRYIVYTNE